MYSNDQIGQAVQSAGMDLDQDVFAGVQGHYSGYETSAYNTYEATRQTVEIMRRLIHRAGGIQTVQQFAARIWHQGIARVTQNGEIELIHNLWNVVRSTVKFTEDERLIQQGVDGRELLISPEVLLSMKHPQGDCDDFSMLVSAVLVLWGYEVRLVTGAAHVDYPLLYSHVWVKTKLPSTGEWIDIDASHGPYVGWNVMSAMSADVRPALVTEWAV